MQRLLTTNNVTDDSLWRKYKRYKNHLLNGN
jgi:hypothetical protein